MFLLERMLWVGLLTCVYVVVKQYRMVSILCRSVKMCLNSLCVCSSVYKDCKLYKVPFLSGI